VGIYQKDYSWKDGKNFLKKNHPEVLKEIKEILENIHIRAYKTKVSEEKGKSKPQTVKEMKDFKNFITKYDGKDLGVKTHAYAFSKKIKNDKEVKKKMERNSWDFQEKAKWLKKGQVGIGPKLYDPKTLNARIGKEFKKLKGWKREEGVERRQYSGSINIDFIKNKVAVEVQLGKYSFVDYDVFVKFPIFKKKRKIDCGVEIVPTNKMLKQMSSGPGNLDRIVSNMKMRGACEIDVPTFVIGVGPK